MTSRDYLVEDPPINGQSYALISIIGPHMRQKCDVWAIKVKGTAHSEESADSMGKRLQHLDPDVDVFRVPVGKYFPLSIDPTTADNTIYQNEQLNEIVKKNKENRVAAKEHFEERKNQMMEDAIKEGKGEEASSSKEHPIAILNRIQKYKKEIQELQDNLKLQQDNLVTYETRFDNFSIEEKQIAADEFNKINGTKTEGPSTSGQSTIQEIESQPIIQEIENSGSIVDSIKEIESKIEKGKVSESEITELKEQLEKLKIKLNNPKNVNNYINSNFQDSKYNNVF
jgi:hypothetical protein